MFHSSRRCTCGDGVFRARVLGPLKDAARAPAPLGDLVLVVGKREIYSSRVQI